jgi:hypothetical protein
MTTAAGSTTLDPGVPHQDHSRSRHRWTVNGVMWLGSTLVAASAGIHLHLWLAGYRDIRTIGPLFIGQAVLGFVLASALAWTRRPLLAILSALFLMATIGGLLTSAWFGLFGFHDGFDAPYAGLSLLVEGFGVPVLCVGALIALMDR